MAATASANASGLLRAAQWRWSLKTGDAIALGLRLRALEEPVLNPDLIRASRVP